MILALRLLVPAGLVLLLAAVASSDETEAPRPVNLAVNTEKDEDDPHLSSSGLSLVYTSTSKDTRELLLSQRSSRNTPWPAGKPLLSGGGKADHASGFLTTDGRYPQYLYFATNYDPVNEKTQKGDNFDLYFLIRQRAGAEFTTQTPLHAVCTAADELHPWLSSDGLHLYFSRKTKEGWRVGVASKPRTGGAFGKPRVLDLPVGFHHPTLTPDGRTLYLQGPLDAQRWGLFRSTAGAKGWTKPEPLEMLHHPEGKRGALSPSLSRDGSLLYFASDRPGGKGGLDLWVVPTAALSRKK